MEDASNLPVTLFQSAFRPSRSSAPVASRARLRALTIRSTAGNSYWCRRNDSRIILRIRLRSTPPPAVRTATARPRRGQPLSFQTAVTPKNPLPNRRPRAYAASKSDLRRKRFCAGRVSLFRAAQSPVKRILRDELSAALGATAGQNGAAVLGGHAGTEPVRARTPHFARLIGALHSMSSVNGPWVPKKGGKAKPLTAKVSIDDSSHALRATLSRLRRRNRHRAYFGASAHAVLGIDCAALFSGPVQAAAEAARGSVSLDSMYLCLGG